MTPEQTQVLVELADKMLAEKRDAEARNEAIKAELIAMGKLEDAGVVEEKVVEAPVEVVAEVTE